MYLRIKSYLCKVWLCSMTWVSWVLPILLSYLSTWNTKTHNADIIRYCKTVKHLVGNAESCGRKCSSFFLLHPTINNVVLWVLLKKQFFSEKSGYTPFFLLRNFTKEIQPLSLALSLSELLGKISKWNIFISIKKILLFLLE